MPPVQPPVRGSHPLNAGAQNTQRHYFNGGYSAIELLPTELRFLIIKYLPVRSICNLALTGPVYYYLISKNEAAIAEYKVVAAVGKDVMRFAAILYELEQLGDHLPRAFSSSYGVPKPEDWALMLQVLNRHSGRDNRNNWHTVSRVTKLSVAAKYLDLHDPVEYWANRLASRALRKLCASVPSHRWQDGPGGLLGAKPKPTAAEMARFRKALYIYQVQSTAFPWACSTTRLRTYRSSYFAAFRRFWEDIAPWEMEQSRQVEILLCCDMASQFVCPVTRYLNVYAYAIEHGLARMRAMSLLRCWRVGRDKAHDVWRSSMQQFWMARVPAAPWDLPPIYFDYDEEEHTNLHAGNIFKRFPGGDDGQKIWWYHDLLMQCEPDMMQQKFELGSVCRYCSITHGYVFWDLKRVTKLTCLEHPSLNDLLGSTGDISISDTDLLVQACLDQGVESVTSPPCSCVKGTT